jgi:MHS family proline/betaine transporter-like MFS transporter
MAAAVFGGFAPFISVWLTNQFNSVMAPTVYVVAASAVSLLVVLRMRETARMPLA